MLVANREMLMRGLTLVGRQVPVESGFVDLLGIDEDGRLVVFEDGIEWIRDFDAWCGSQRGESIRPVRMVLVGVKRKASEHGVAEVWQDSRESPD